ncbi:MAG: DnaJ domain-containing protein [Synechococcaceae cyanobacterium SM2_3_1]|nr:DnaJ domain-containing protein [Synechococcaceae cyanobacterium SM2_3_1]
MARMSDSRQCSYYQILGLSPEATASEIKEAYRGLAQQLHPDKFPPQTPAYLRSLAERDFQTLQMAYRVLSDPETRQQYDRALQSFQAAVEQRGNAYSGSLSRSSEGATHLWQLLLAACIGAALTFSLLSVWELFAPYSRQTATASGYASDPDTEVPRQPPLLIPSPPPPSKPFSPTVDQLQRFVLAHLQVEPILVETHQLLKAADNPQREIEIEEKFQVQASEVIQSQGLTPETYQQIVEVARQDPQVRRYLSALASQQRAQSQEQGDRMLE